MKDNCVPMLTCAKNFKITQKIKNCPGWVSTVESGQAVLGHKARKNSSLVDGTYGSHQVGLAWVGLGQKT